MWLEARRLAGGDDVRPYKLRMRASTYNNRLRPQENPPSSHKFPLPHMLHNPLRGASMRQAPVMKTPSAAIAHIQLKNKLGTRPSRLFQKDTFGAGGWALGAGATLGHPLISSKKWIWIQSESNFQGLQGGSDRTLYQEPPDLGAVVE